MAYEDQQPPDADLLATIAQLQQIQQHIISMAMFSPNEHFNEIHTENLK